MNEMFSYLVTDNIGCVFPFTYMNVTYTSCADISGQSLCVATNFGKNGQFPIAFVGCRGSFAL